jgi:hypothetical protein
MVWFKFWTIGNYLQMKHSESINIRLIGNWKTAINDLRSDGARFRLYIHGACNAPSCKHIVFRDVLHSMENENGQLVKSQESCYVSAEINPMSIVRFRREGRSSVCFIKVSIAPKRFFQTPSHWGVKPSSRLVTPPNHRSPIGSQFCLHPQSFCYTSKLKILENSLLHQHMVSGNSQRLAGPHPFRRMTAVGGVHRLHQNPRIEGQ